MKTHRVPLWLFLALAGTGRMLAFDSGGPRVEVAFFEPAHFTDVSDSYPGGSDQGRDATLAELKSHLVKRALYYLAPGQKLTVTVTDVDLAGEFEPWRGAQWGDVRIVKDIYPPCIELSFQLKDADGNIVKSGKRVLRDLAFLMKISINDSDPLRHEKALLDDWLSAEFRNAKHT
jgi:hypothetical protein